MCVAFCNTFDSIHFFSAPSSHLLYLFPPRPPSFPRALAAFATAQTEPGMYSRDGNLNIEVGAGKSILLKQGDQDEVDLLAQLASLEADLASYEVKKEYYYY